MIQKSLFNQIKYLGNDQRKIFRTCTQKTTHNDSVNGRKYHVHGLDDSILLHYLLFLTSIYIFTGILIKTSADLIFVEIDKLVLKFIWEKKRIRRAVVEEESR